MSKDIFNLDTIYNTIVTHKVRFSVVFMLVLFSTFGFFYLIDFLPEPATELVVVAAESAVTEAEADEVSEREETDINLVIDEHETITNENMVATERVTTFVAPQTVDSEVMYQARPIRMRIDALDRTIPILNPTSRSIPDLDAALQHGAVRHPDAADFRREGNIFIMGHSSRLPNVRNRNYQIFNDIETLQWGDIIRLYSEENEYIYRVDRVYEAKASALVVPIANTGPRLTLVTCDTLGAIEDRFIVEAELQSSRPIW